jgi:hypothetical protein
MLAGIFNTQLNIFEIRLLKHDTRHLKPSLITLVRSLVLAP